MPFLDISMAKMSAAVIGLRKHAGLHIKMLKEDSRVSLDRVYYHQSAPIEFADLPITGDLSECIDSDIIIVSSPTDRHLEQLEYLGQYSGYILIEKPAVNTQEQIEKLLQLPDEIKRRMRVNFNFQFHDLGILVRELIKSGKLGRIFSFDMHSTHGAAFRGEWKNAWRIKGGTGLGPLETTGIHYVQYASSLFGDCQDSTIYTDCLSGKEGAVDTGILNLVMGNGVWARIRHSYAAPCAVRMEIWGTEGYFIYDDDGAALHYPRETFDDRGYFKKPPQQEQWSINFQQAWSSSLVRAQADFVSVAAKRGEFATQNFDRDVRSMEALLNGRRI